MAPSQIDLEIATLISRGAMFVVNHSGGKDSQAMLLRIRERVPAAQIVVVHAHLPEVEWDGVLDHINATAGGLPVHVCQARRTLLRMIEERGMFPSPQQRQCTSDLKRGPIERTIRGLGYKLIVNCMGMRAEESPNRAKLDALKVSVRNSKAGREWYDWLPIHGLKAGDVFDIIGAAGQQPHWAYSAGMTRLSCCFCIMSSQRDLATAARLNPTLYRRYVDLERSIGRTMLMPSKTLGRRTLEQITGVAA
ncbi:MAG: phosphoadenosine phosphosulfate reductase family protein [Alphaproteobacteria bacterium]|nr:phosphoadenosine phosphosulfate reductase family protein [Alphaproteobacteria bacterium]